MKRKDRKKFKRQDIKISNIEVIDPDDFLDDEVVAEKKASKRLRKKSDKSQKSDLQLIPGRIIEVNSNYKCKVKTSENVIDCHVSGRLKNLRLETRNIISVGDYVKIDIHGQNRIEEIEPRKNKLIRYTEDRFQKKIIIASNIDNVVIITSCHDPELNLGMVDRLICISRINEIQPVICINKVDLAEDLSLIKKQAEFYQENSIGVVFTSAKSKTGIEDLQNILRGKDSVFVGHSGVGKSSLINQLQPDLNLRVASISDYSGKGIHTTTRSRIFAWNFGGNLIDTPGIKTLTLHEESKELIKYVFPGIKELSVECKYLNCTHTHENDCEVKRAVQKNQFDQERYASYLRILESFSGVNYE